MSGKLAFSMSTRAGCVGILKEGYHYRGSRVIRADSMEVLEARAKAAERCDWWVTMNGSHVLIKGDRIIGGAGGRLNGKTFGTQFTKGARSRWLKNRRTWAGRSLGNVTAAGSEGPAPQIKDLTQMRDALGSAGFTCVFSWQFKDLDEDLVVANMNRILELEQKFGVVKTMGDVILSAVDMWGPEDFATVACVSMDVKLAEDTELQFNRKCYGKDSRRVEKTESQVKNGKYMPCKPEDYPAYAAVHEYGHLLQNVLYKKELQKLGWSRSNKNALVNQNAYEDTWMADRYFEAYNKVQSRCVREIEKIGKRKDPNFKLFDHLSDYGRTNYAEAFAEMFANSQCGAPNAAGDAMNIWLKEKGFLKA